MNIRKFLLTATAIAGCSALVAAPGLARDLSVYEDRDSVTISGTVSGVSGDVFYLDYNGGRITVEMDDWDWFDNEAEVLKKGEKVTVYGRIDDDLFEARTIEAGTVYVQDRMAYYFANDADEELDYVITSATVTIPDGTWLQASGTVKSVSGREFILGMGHGDIQVDTGNMAFNPMDDTGFLQVDPGDRVTVHGPLDVGFFEDHEIQARVIAALNRDKMKRNKDTASN